VENSRGDVFGANQSADHIGQILLWQNAKERSGMPCTDGW
jgi:hypothetical protein